MNRQVSGHQFKKKKKLMLRIKFPQEENWREITKGVRVLNSNWMQIT
jgi:hypothetical protein